ncbi:autotransporter-associated beta strand repeat-containing protein [Puniceicoccus vermicola]|uniref:PEP-CTERM sorting domain-containing protein n=1 Tax=Puniceicoccus vermicola TaxID=388746 RepID=A0A7X1E6F3_9BACT|nr:autotransporter-associated beta strand repeat-containing protein [Puniceicoccus vermicola]MBC2602632.1 hypothetical protein [Puniceicoccus vermicola]
MNILPHYQPYSRKLVPLLIGMVPVLGLQATDYQWDSSSSGGWGDSINWSPVGIPGVSDNVTGASQLGNLEVRGNESIDNFSYAGNIGNWQVVGVGDVSLSIGGTLSLSGDDNLAFRKSSGSNTFDLSVNNIDMSGSGILLVGANNSVNSIQNLSVSGTTSVGTGGQLRINVDNDYSIGEVVASGGGEVYLNSAPQDKGPIMATSSGLSGGGGTIFGGLFSGNATTLRIEVLSAKSSGTVLADLDSSLALVVAGSSSQTLYGNNTYTGGTEVESGSLVAGSTSALGSGNVTVNGGTLDSESSVVHIGGSLNLNGGELQINGENIGSYQLASGEVLTLDGGTIVFDYDKDAEINDVITSLGGAAMFNLIDGIIDLGGSDWDYSTTYTLFSGFDSGTVGTITFENYDTANWEASLNSSGELSFEAIPESQAILTVIPGVVGLFVLFRRRRK